MLIIPSTEASVGGSVDRVLLRKSIGVGLYNVGQHPADPPLTPPRSGMCFRPETGTYYYISTNMEGQEQRRDHRRYRRKKVPYFMVGKSSMFIFGLLFVCFGSILLLVTLINGIELRSIEYVFMAVFNLAVGGALLYLSRR